MKNPFEWFHNLYYGEKNSLSAFDTKNPTSLDALLKQLYMTAHHSGYLLMKNSLPAFNAAYCVAVCILQSEAIDETNLDEEIDYTINTIWLEDYKRTHKAKVSHCPFTELVLIKWMVYAILFLQEEKSHEMAFFLVDFRKNLEVQDEDESIDADEYDWGIIDAMNSFDETILDWKYRYRTSLRPHPLHPKFYTSKLWIDIVRHYSLDDLKLQLALFPTIDEQLAFLNWAKEESQKPQPMDYLDDSLPFN